MNLQQRVTAAPWPSVQDWLYLAASTVTVCICTNVKQNVLSQCFLEKIKKVTATKSQGEQRNKSEEVINQPEWFLLLYWKQPCLVSECYLLQFISRG